MIRTFRCLVLLASGSLMIASPALAGEGNGVQPVAPLMMLPFIALLLAIAIVPFINRHWWEKNYLFVSFGLGLVTVAYYLFWLGNPARMWHTFSEYVSFVVLIGSLFVVAGGIHIRIRGESTPIANVFLLAIGAVMSNIIGTTGASMILIRPFLRVNKHRIKPFHVVFFIFVVSNLGGALTPIGDPPLFLGYLRGIPFFWVLENVWLIWLVVVGGVLAIFFVLDLRSFRALPRSVKNTIEHTPEEGEVVGLQNVFFLAMIIVAVFVARPLYIRELLMVVAAAGSYFTTHREIHKKNDFNFQPIKEVAILFAGIFATMVPALDWLELNAGGLGIHTAGHFYWATGSLSAFLDNAPTYLNFLSAAIGLFVNNDIVTQVQHLVQTYGTALPHLTGAQAAEIKATYETLLKYHFDLVAAGSVPTDDIATAYLIGNHSIYIQAISIGAVFFGACSYIGNGPNFMVKSIAEQSGVHCPSFFGYIAKFTIPVLLPLFTLAWYFFFRG